MQVQSIGSNLQTKNIFKNGTNFKISDYNTMSTEKYNQVDIFEKRNVSLSFKGNGKKNEEESLVDKLSVIGMVGAPFLLSITAGLLISDDNFIDSALTDAQIDVDASEKSLSLGVLSADADDGIFSIKGTPIDIRPERFDYCDPENGIYTNFDGSVNIDLLNGKYIDKENGIFVDQAEGISAFIDSSGNAKHFALPTFKGSSMSGSNWGTSAINDTPVSEDEGRVLPDLLHTIKHSPLFAKFFGSEEEQIKDMFGRDITKAIGDSGETYISTTLAGANGILSGISGQAIEALNDGRFQKYLNEQIAQHGFSGEVSFGIDFTGDGKIDATLMDTDGDGKFDGIDLDGDGKIEGTLIDIDGDGQYDGIDIDGDGIPDIMF